ETDGEGAQALERLGRGFHGRAQIVERLAYALLEEREEQLVLAVEVLVETAQRLLRVIDDFLDRELGRPPLVDQRERRIHEALHALLGAAARRAQALRDRAMTPTGSVSLLRLIGSRHGSNHP